MYLSKLKVALDSRGIEKRVGEIVNDNADQFHDAQSMAEFVIDIISEELMSFIDVDLDIKHD